MRKVGINKKDIESRAKKTSAKLNPVKKAVKSKPDNDKSEEQGEKDSEESE